MTAKTTAARKPTAAARKARTARITAQAVFGLGLVVSLAANVAASEASLPGIAAGLWSPVALLLAIVLLENGSIKGRAAKAAVIALAAIAGWTSYWHLVEVLEMAGTHDPISLYGMPLTVDVLMALASAAMKPKPAARRRPAARKAAAKVTKLRAA
jgi:hypothetical protein